MKFLIIDSSTEKSLIVISEGYSPLLTIHLPIGLQSSSHIMTVIQSGFEKLKIFPCDLKAVAVTTGPGSFTGTRVGAAVGKGIAFGSSLPIISLNSLSAFVSTQAGCFASLIDARVGGAYLLIQEKNGDQIIELTTPELIPIEKLKEKTQGCISIIGPSFKRLEIEGGIERYPDERHLAKITYQKFLNKDFSEEGELQFSYLRPMEYSSLKK